MFAYFVIKDTSSIITNDARVKKLGTRKSSKNEMIATSTASGHLSGLAQTTKPANAAFLLRETQPYQQMCQ